MESDKPDKPEVKSGAGVTVAEEAPPSFKDNVKEEIELLKKKMQKENIFKRLRSSKTRPGLNLQIHLSRQARADAALPVSGRADERLSSPAPGQDQSRCRQVQLYLGHGRDNFLSVYSPDLHRHSADVSTTTRRRGRLTRTSSISKTTCRSGSCCAICIAGPRT